METIKSALGYGQQSGEEPVSGHTGQGTAIKPFDAGNAQDSAPVTAPTSPTSPTSPTAAAAMAASATQSGVEPVSGVKGDGSALSPYDAGNSDDKALGGQAPQVASAIPKVDGAAEAKAAEDQVLATTDIKPLDSTANADATASQDRVIESTTVKPLEPESTAAAGSSTGDDKVIESTAIKPLDADTSKPSTAAGTIGKIKEKVEDKVTSPSETDKPLPATPAKTTAADSSLTATPQIEKIGNDTPGTTGSHSKREKLKEKFGSIRAKFSSSPKS